MRNGRACCGVSISADKRNTLRRYDLSGRTNHGGHANLGESCAAGRLRYDDLRSRHQADRLGRWLDADGGHGNACKDQMDQLRKRSLKDIYSLKTHVERV